MAASTLYDRIYSVIEAIPPGFVMTYGQVGSEVGCPARVVGYALHHLRHVVREVPWQRVVNARGGISTYGAEQQHLLESEGIVFDENGIIDLERWTWDGNTA